MTELQQAERCSLFPVRGRVSGLKAWEESSLGLLHFGECLLVCSPDRLLHDSLHEEAILAYDRIATGGAVLPLPCTGESIRP
jgi:hypothetical protein